MFKRNWVPHPLLGVGLIISTMYAAILFGGLGANQKQEYLNEDRIEYSAEENAVQTSRSTPPQHPSDYSTTAPAPQWWEMDDLKAQQEMARWTKIIGGLTFIGVLLLGWTLWETNQTARHAQAMLAQQQRTDHLQLQAYIDITRATLTVAPSVKSGRYDFALNIYVKNFGNTPTRKFTYRTDVTFLDVRTGPVIPDHGRGPMSASRNVGEVHPGQERQIRYEFTWRVCDLEFGEDGSTRAHVRFRAAYLDNLEKRHDCDLMIVSEIFYLSDRTYTDEKLIKFPYIRRSFGYSDLPRPGQYA